MEASWWINPDQLDDEQKEVIALPLDGNHLILGPPGSGKTNLVLLRGAYLQASGHPNYQILTFGRVLREFIVSGTSTTSVAPNKVNTYVGWASDILNNIGIPFRVEGDFKELRSSIHENLKRLTDEDIADFRADCILIDESQDYSASEIDNIARFSNQIFAVGDNRQRIYAEKGAIGRLEQICPSTTKLQYHYRNGAKICRVADGIVGAVGKPDGLEATSQYREADAPSQVLCFDAEPIADQVSRVVATIPDQLRAYPTALIGILCPLRNDVKAVWELLTQSHLQNQIQLQLQEMGYGSIDPDRRVLVGTIHGAKGLEFRALHLLATEGIGAFPRNRARIAYTAVTRAKTSLAIYRNGDLIGPLENGLAAIAPPPSRVDLDDLFRA